MVGTTLTPRARARLRSLAHDLEPIVHIGEEGVSEGVARATSTALEDHELIKVKVGRACPEDRHQVARALAAATHAAVAQVIGRVVVLYRRRARDLPRKPRIELP